MSEEQPAVQAFRQGKDVKLLSVIPSDVPGQPSFVFLEDVQYFFPGAKYFQSGDVSLAFMRDTNHHRYMPERIPCHPDRAVIDVLTCAESPSQTLTPNTSTPSSPIAATANACLTLKSHPPGVPEAIAPHTPPWPRPVSVNSPPIPPRPSLYISGNSVPDGVPTSSAIAPTPTPTTISISTSTAAVAVSPVITTSGTAGPSRRSATQGPNVRVIALAIPDIQPSPLRDLIVAKPFVPEITPEGLELVRKVKELELANNVSPPHYSATTTQSTPLATAPSNLRPNLLMVRQCTVHNDIQGNKYGVQFLCEGDGPVHFPEHRGYQIKANYDFFSKYWPILLCMTTVLQARLQNEAKEQTPSLDLQTTLEEAKRMVKMLEMVKMAEKSGTRRVWSQHELTHFLKTGNGVNGLDLKDLSAYLEVGLYSEMQGGLRRIKVATGGHKWLCKEHCQQEGLQRLRNWTRIYKMKLDETLKTVEAIVKAEHIAEGLYENIVDAETIEGLGLTLKWDHEFKSLLKLQDFMSKSRLSTLTLNLANYSGDQFDGGALRYKPVLEMAQQPSLQNLTLKGLPTDFFKRSNLAEGIYNFSNLVFLRLDHSISEIKDLKKFKTMLLAASELSVLVLNASESNFVKTFNLIQEARTGDHPPMQLQFRSEKPSAEVLLQIVFPPLSAQATSICPPAKIMDTEHLFEDYGSRIQRLQYTGISNSIIEALDRGTSKESNLLQLTLWTPAIDSNKGVDSLIKVMGQDQLQGLQCDISKPAQLSVLKAIQWTKLQHLMVNADIYPKGIERILTEVYAAVKAVSHKPNSEIALQEFIFKGSGFPPTKEDLELFEKVLRRLTELREFSLNLCCSVEGCCKLVKYLVQTNTRLERLILNGAGYSSNNVAQILNYSQILSSQSASGSRSAGGSGLKGVFRKLKAPANRLALKMPASSLALKTVVIRNADLSAQLVAQMKAKGIELRDKVVV